MFSIELNILIPAEMISNLLFYFALFKPDVAKSDKHKRLCILFIGIVEINCLS